MNLQESKTILLVEDEAITALAESQAIKKFGYNVITVGSGKKAVEIAITDKTISLVLMDIKLGQGNDGTEIARQILAKRNIPIIFLTSHSEREIMEKVCGITRYGYVNKNSGDFVLQSSIEMAFELFEAHEKTSKSEARQRTLLQTIPDLVWLKDADGVYLSCNHMFEKFFGAREADIIGKTDYDFVNKELADFFRENDLKAMAAGKPSINEEWITFKSDGHRALLETIKTPVFENGGRLIGVLGIARNITKRKQAEERVLKLNRIYAVLSNINQAIVRIHETWELLNEACRIAFEYGKFRMAWIGLVNTQTNKVDVAASYGASEDYLNKINIDLNDELRSNGPTGTAIKTGKHKISNNIKHDESMIPWRDDAMKYDYKSSASFPLIVFDKAVGAFNIYSNETDFFDEEDISLLDEMTKDMSFALEFIESEAKRKGAEDKLKTALLEKEALLRELYHRTKNNMQMICAMLTIHSLKIDDSELKNIFKDIETRIHSMALVHQKLYKSKDLSNINLNEYAVELINLLMKSYSISPDRISIDLNIENISVLIDIAIPCGLILNELVSNSLKYAFPEERHGKISLSITKREQTINICYSDDGVGLPQGFNYRNDGKMGLQSVISIVEDQLLGNISITPEKGFDCDISFKNALYKARI